LFAFTVHAQSDLSGVIDIHAHVDPDSMPRSIDAIDWRGSPNSGHARTGPEKSLRIDGRAGLHRPQEVPGIEIFGGIDLNLTWWRESAAVERMVLMKAAGERSLDAHVRQ